MAPRSRRHQRHLSPAGAASPASPEPPAESARRSTASRRSSSSRPSQSPSTAPAPRVDRLEGQGEAEKHQRRLHPRRRDLDDKRRKPKGGREDQRARAGPGPVQEQPVPDGGGEPSARIESSFATKSGSGKWRDGERRPAAARAAASSLQTHARPDCRPDPSPDARFRAYRSEIRQSS